MRARGRELLGHKFVDREYKRFRKIASANSRLIGHHDYRHSSFIQPADGFSDTRQDTKSADMIQVSDFFGNSAVAI
jgi:hypothetical protein